MGHDQTAYTGWTGKSGDGVAEYHDQFYWFRGYAFFEADVFLIYHGILPRQE